MPKSCKRRAIDARKQCLPHNDEHHQTPPLFDAEGVRS